MAGSTEKLTQVSLESLKPYERNAKLHPHDQIERLKKSIQEFGFVSPCLIDDDKNIIAGHGRIEAAKELGLKEVPCVYVSGLTEEQRRAYILADNRLTELGGWDEYALQEELAALFENGFDIDLTGFEFNPEEVANRGGGTESVNPTSVLPPSRVYFFSVSAFGTDSEKILSAPIQPETAALFIEKAAAYSPGELTERIEVFLNGL